MCTGNLICWWDVSQTEIEKGQPNLTYLTNNGSGDKMTMWCSRQWSGLASSQIGSDLQDFWTVFQTDVDIQGPAGSTMRREEEDNSNNTIY